MDAEGTEILLLLTLPGNEGMEVDILLAVAEGGTGVAFGERVFLIVVLPLALEDALGFMVGST